jgi:hypothetical protein
VDLLQAKIGGVIRRGSFGSGAEDGCDGSDIRANGRDEDLCTLICRRELARELRMTCENKIKVDPGKEDFENIN